MSGVDPHRRDSYLPGPYAPDPANTNQPARAMTPTAARMPLTIGALLAWLLLAPTVLHAQEDASPERDPAMEATIRQAWAEVNAFLEAQREGVAPGGEDPQPAHARRFFAYYLEHPETLTGREAGVSAFAMWANLGAIEAMEAALPRIGADSELWSSILRRIRITYERHGRRTEYVALLERLEGVLTHPRSRSEVALALGDHYLAEEDPERARRFYERVAELAAHPAHVQKARGTLHEMDVLAVGAVAPDFTAPTIDGAPVRLSDLRGKVVLLEFWATTCGPCLPEIPRLKAMREGLPPEDLQIIGITDDEDAEALRHFLAGRGMDWPQIRQRSRWEGGELIQDEVFRLYNIYGLPRSFLLDRGGRIVAKDLRGERLVEAVTRLVGATGG